MPYLLVPPQVYLTGDFHWSYPINLTRDCHCSYSLVSLHREALLSDNFVLFFMATACGLIHRARSFFPSFSFLLQNYANCVCIRPAY